MRRLTSFLAALLFAVPALAQSFPSPIFQLFTARGCTGYMLGNGTSPVSCAATIPGAALAAGAAAANLGYAPVIRPEDYGAVGNGAADDAAALQSWANACMTSGFSCQLTRGKIYLHSTTVTFKEQTADGTLGSYTPPSGVLFVKKRVPVIEGNGAIVKATATMSQQFLFIYNEALTAQSTYNAELRNVQFEGNALAGANVFLNYAFRMRIIGNRMKGATTYGFRSEGYGGHMLMGNQISAPTCVFAYDGGFNDMTAEQNDLYPTANAFKIQQGPIRGSGDFHIHRNIITVDGGNPIGVYVDANTGTTQANGHITIRDNDFFAGDGSNGSFFAGIYLDGKVSADNLRTLKVSGNRMEGGAGNFITVNNAADVTVSDNSMGGTTFYGAMSGGFLSAANVKDMRVTGNNVTNTTGPVMNLFAVSYSNIAFNNIRNVGDVATNNVVIQFSDAGSIRNQISMNTIVQTDAGRSPYGILEWTGPNFNWAYDNILVGLTTPYTKTGANSFFENRH